MSDNCRFLVVSGGKVSEEVLRNLLSTYRYDRIIAVDKGLEALDLIKVTPDIICGDFDTVNAIIFNKYKKKNECKIIEYPPQKDYTDTHLSVEIAIDNGASIIDICGATGGRIDHLLGNIAVIAYGLEKKVKVNLFDDNNKIYMIDESLFLEKENCFGNYISLIPYGKDVDNITLKGFKYPLNNEVLKLSETRGISNEMIGERAGIEYYNGRLIVIESKD